MKSIKFLIMGDVGVGKSTLLHVYLWKLNCGIPYHDHRIKEERYMIDALEIVSFDQLRRHHVNQNAGEIIINILCFNVADRKTLSALRTQWIPEIWKQTRNAKMFLMGLQCDLREQFLTRLTQNCFSNADGMNLCNYYEHLYYVECSSLKLASVNEAFETVLEIFFYENVQKQLEEQILKLYAAMQIKFEFYGPINWLKNVDDDEVEKKEDYKHEDMENLDSMVDLKVMEESYIEMKEQVDGEKLEEIEEQENVKEENDENWQKDEVAKEEENKCVEMKEQYEMMENELMEKQVDMEKSEEVEEQIEGENVRNDDNWHKDELEREEEDIQEEVEELEEMDEQEVMEGYNSETDEQSGTSI